MRPTIKLGTAASVLLLAALATGCSTGTSDTSSTADASMTELQKREAALKARESDLASKERMLSQQERDLMRQGASSGSTAAVGDGLLPPYAKPGECYARAFTPPVYATETSQVVKREAGERIEIIPAKYGKGTEQILVQEASEKLVVIPATYKYVTEQVLVTPAKQTIVQVPPVYGTVTERVLDKPAHTTWKKGSGPIQKIDSGTGEIMCLVEVPATYRTITKTVLKSPASTKTIEKPAVYKTVKRKVVDRPATTQSVPIPAVYKTVTVTKLLQPAQEKRIPIPAQYGTVTSKKLVSDGKMEWRQILCDTNMTRSKITQIQSALKSKGYNPGPIDGVIGSETMQAVNAFQRKNNLPVDKYLNIATVQALGVAPR